MTKCKRIQSLVNTGAKPSYIPRPPGPKPTGPAAGAPKAPAPMTAVAMPALVASVEEGEVLVGETLLSLRGGFPRWVLGSTFGQGGGDVGGVEL